VCEPRRRAEPDEVDPGQMWPEHAAEATAHHVPREPRRKQLFARHSSVSSGEPHEGALGLSGGKRHDWVNPGGPPCRPSGRFRASGRAYRTLARKVDRVAGLDRVAGCDRVAGRLGVLVVS
jgi:hypothetical protein